MDKHQAKRRVRRSHNSRIIEAELVLREGTSSQVTTLIHRLETSNEELRKINEKLEPLIPEAEFEA